MSHRLILATESRYKTQLLSRLQIPFDTDAPRIDETPLANEPPRALSVRLAQQKAEAIRGRHSDSWIIGADQTAAAGDQLLEKPGTRSAAKAQLMSLSGQTVCFMTSMHLIDPTGAGITHTESVTVKFRALDCALVDRYINKEDALDCCGGFKVEGLGIALFESIQSQDPTALEGLPLIQLSQWLSAAGFQIP